RAEVRQNRKAVCRGLVFNANRTRIGDLSRNSGVMAARPRQRRPAPGRVAQGNVRLLAGIILLLGLLGFHAYKHWNAEPETVIIGKPWIIDGDTISIAGTHIRLEGIDAPESDQTCADSKGRTWNCGKAAAAQLSAHIAGRELTCQRRALD